MIGGGFVDPMFQVNNYESYLNSIGIIANQWKKATSSNQN